MPLLRDRDGNDIGVDLDPSPAERGEQLINVGREEEQQVLLPGALELIDWLAQELEAKRIFSMTSTRSWSGLASGADGRTGVRVTT